MSTPFVAIDFETADAKRDSACAVALVRVEGGEVVRRESALIRPPRGMAAVNQSVHGLSWADVKDASANGDAWPKLAPVLEGVGRIVAHNAAFDRSVLRACCCAAKLAEPVREWACTVELCRKKLPGQASYKLPDVCRLLGVRLARHHEARADAEAAALVYLAVTGQMRAPAPESKPVPVEWVPVAEVGEILSQIPAEHRTPAAVALMRDAEKLGPLHAADLVRTLAERFGRQEPGKPRCACGQRCSLICDLCTACIRKLP